MHVLKVLTYSNCIVTVVLQSKALFNMGEKRNLITVLLHLLQKEKKHSGSKGSRATARLFSMAKIVPSFDKLLKFDNY